MAIPAFTYTTHLKLINCIKNLPNKIVLATIVFAPKMHQCFNFSIIAVRPWGNQLSKSAAALAANQHRYVPQAAVYNS